MRTCSIPSALTFAPNKGDRAQDYPRPGAKLRPLSENPADSETEWEIRNWTNSQESTRHHFLMRVKTVFYAPGHEIHIT